MKECRKHRTDASNADRCCVNCSTARVNLLSELEPLSLHFLAVCLEEAVELGHGGFDLLVCIAEAVLHLHNSHSCQCTDRQKTSSPVNLPQVACPSMKVLTLCKSAMC